MLLALATLCGAFGAHALAVAPAARAAARLGHRGALPLHAVPRPRGDRAVPARAADAAALRGAAALIVAGAVLFSGSLYALALGAPAALGLFTPLGGLAWIAAWLLFAAGVWRPQSKE